MIKFPPKYSLFGVDYSATDYESASDLIIQMAIQRTSFAVSALAVHGLITAVRDIKLKSLIKKIDMIVPDGQPIRWALNSFHKIVLKDRVYGPTLTLYVLKKANEKNLKIYLYGSTKETLNKFSLFITQSFPNLIISGIHVDRFREATPKENEKDIKKINASGANIVLVGRGCPRQEIWVAEHQGKIQAAMMAVGAAFDFHAGTLKQAPKWVQDYGFEWLFRLIQEPKRLWKRYLITNSYFILLFFKNKFIHRSFT